MYLPIVSMRRVQNDEGEAATSQPLVVVDLSELLSRHGELRPVSPSSRPAYIGGTNTSSSSPDSPLKKEIMATAVKFHEKIRPRMDYFSQQKASKPVVDELKSILREYDDITEYLEFESSMRPKYALDSFLAEQPGWLDLQSELRQVKRSKLLKPVVFDDFYIIRSAQQPV